MLSRKCLEQVVDVVIPTHNDLNFAKRAVLSVARQSSSINKCIVVDDGSTKPVLTHDFPANLPFQLEIIRTNGIGLAAARNLGLRKSSAFFVALLDADDEWLPGKIESQLRKMELNPFAPACFTGALLSDIDGFEIGKNIPSNHVGNLTNLLKDKCVITGSASSILIRRSAIAKVGFFDEGLTFAEDMDMWLRLSSQGPILPILECLTKITKNPESMQRAKSPELLARIELTAKLEILTKCDQYKNYRHIQIVKAAAKVLLISQNKRQAVVEIKNEFKNYRFQIPLRKYPSACLTFIKFVIQSILVRARERAVKHG